MNRIARFPVMAAATLSLLVLMTGCQRLKARDQLNKGVQAYKSAKYEEAINHFQQAVNYDPTLPMARSYLATAYAQQVVPDLTTSDNLKNANLAIQNFQTVLAQDPKDVNSLKGIASIYFNIGKYQDAKDWQKKVLEVDPQDAEAAYTIGSIDWRLAYRNAVKDLQAVGMQDDGMGNAKMPKKACQDLLTDNSQLVNEGLEYLHKAVEIRPSYDDAMAYLQLTYRRKADLECGNDSARKDDMAQVDQWREKAMSTRKANEEKKNSQTQGVVMQ
ncbi:tetratricopeptide (TPR) repeat protein [Silvibacterium bohemicum]|uniref:Tetratricopeptide (TPR) repeat protein n=1 Tax=Silvibacterium bohemicum TaxID=1577686 RepID=A0A841K0H9_9BACT|nr:tetratricopeptide repeat protein [Silvibacterium bohemicum]MBB6145459.1 tetratricopeptide (TPR) repeat protein [Silvibacterium bohemicum]